MWIGVAIGLAVLKFSGSPRTFGIVNDTTASAMIISSAGVLSFVEKNGWNGSLSIAGLFPMGFEDPAWCSRIKCTSTAAISTIGVMK
jgi:hypothetical protein